MEFGAGSGFKFGFRFWVPRHSTRTEPDPLPSLVVMAYQTMKWELRSFFGINIFTLKEYIEMVDERLGDVFIGTYVGPGKHTRVIYF